MLDYNHAAGFAEGVNALIDAALETDEAARPARAYLGGSRLGVPCERALQYEYAAAPKDDGADFDGKTLRIFAAGHLFEDLAAGWLRAAGFELYTRRRVTSRPTSPSPPTTPRPPPRSFA